MRTPSRASTYGLATLAGFGVVYDSGILGPADGLDHSAPFVMNVAPSTGSLSPGGGVLVMTNAITGEDFAVPVPVQKKVTKAST